MTDKPNEDVKVVKGKFLEKLTLSNKAIKDARAQQIARAVGLKYKRLVEDLETKLEDLKAERDNATDLAPDTALSLKPAKDFDADAFVTEDLKLSLNIRNTEIQLKKAKERYTYLFSDEEV